ncbi:HD domain-containing protein [Ferrimonas balearica]|uniref:HD domain-containing protein n=1 Tax=Ferrimonas balearica TaxID=44012 RepID=UPI001C9969E0|nr:HD domain-containing protein [Ferrimonas balearica]MBY5922752.1 HD domain-containing protein [Ferrimonas balearica]MBY5995736.1 HD domain-containing protein [Ferrimonas balearica]
MNNASSFDTHWQQRCREWAAAAGSDGAHDLTHIERVVATATRLGQEANANLDVILPAAWLHDVVLVDKRDPRRNQASLLSADKAVILLGEAGYPAEHMEAIHHAIVSHSWSAGIEPTTLEAQIVQDADRLDALGAIGLSRCLMLGGQWNRALYHDADPLGQSRDWDDNQYNLDHLFIKLQHLPDQLRTDAGRAEGQRRWAWMQGYLDQLALELGLNP